MKCLIDYEIVNNNEKIKKENIHAIYNDNKLSFMDEKEKIKIIINKDNIILNKDNIDSIIEFSFIKNKKNEFKYFIKLLSSYINSYVYTKELIINKNDIYIEYDIYVEEEYIGNFKYKITIKEM